MMKIWPLLLTFFIYSCANESQQRQMATIAEVGPIIEPTVDEPNPIGVVIQGEPLLEQTGCWVKLYEEVNLMGEKIIAYNGIELPRLDFSEHYNWQGRISSLQVGPHARVIIYRRPYFAEKGHTIIAKSSITSLTGIGWTAVESLRLICLGR
jgi:hypothetical protein